MSIFFFLNNSPSPSLSSIILSNVFTINKTAVIIHTTALDPALSLSPSSYFPYPRFLQHFFFCFHYIHLALNLQGILFLSFYNCASSPYQSFIFYLFSQPLTLPLKFLRIFFCPSVFSTYYLPYFGRIWV